MLRVIFPILISYNLFAYGIGITSHPLALKKPMITTEMVGHVSEGKGIGLQARFTQRLAPTVTIDAGVGISDSTRSNRAFFGTDIEFYPDYDKQPRIALKATVENAEEFGARRNIISIAPLISKGFNAWGAGVYPFLAFPVQLALKSEDKSYEMRTNISFGLTSKFPATDYERLLLNIEGNVNVSNSFSAVQLGITYSIE